MGLNGPEHTSKTPEKQHNPKTTGPISGPIVTDTDLQTVIDRWYQLPPPIRRQIVKLAHPRSLALDGVGNKIPNRLDNTRGQTYNTSMKPHAHTIADTKEPQNRISDPLPLKIGPENSPILSNFELGDGML